MKNFDSSSAHDELLSALEHRFGNVMGQAVYDSLNPAPIPPLHSHETLQLQNITERLRQHLYAQIGQHRAQRRALAAQANQIIDLTPMDETNDRAVILQIYQRYRQTNRVFHALHQKCVDQQQDAKKCNQCNENSVGKS